MTPRTRALTALSPLFALTLNACFFAPQEVVRFRAERAGSTWSNGLELHSANTRQLEIRSGFLGYSHDKVHGYSGPYPLFFLISATNESDSSALIDPLDFRIGVLGQGKDSTLAAIDPEAALYKVRQDMAAEVACHASPPDIEFFRGFPVPRHPWLKTCPMPGHQGARGCPRSVGWPSRWREFSSRFLRPTPNPARIRRSPADSGIGPEFD